MAAAELQQPLVPQQPQRPQDGIGVDLQHGGQVAGGREPFARADLAVGDRAADLGADLVLERQRVAPVQFDIQHDASKNSTMSFITLSEAERAQRDAPEAQALIAEARAHARRRRLKMAAALAVLAVAVAAGVLIGRAVSTHAAVKAHPRPAPAAGMGTVTGHLAACFGVAPLNWQQYSTPGTVVVLRGSLSWKPDGPGTWRLVYPKGPVVDSQHISRNYDQMFRFALPPGHYVLAGRYDSGPGFATFREVTVTAGAVIRVDLPNLCK